MASNKQLREILDDIAAAPSGPQVAAIFDFDGTLIAGYSATAFLREQIMSGGLSPRDFVQQFEAVRKFATKKVGFSALMNATANTLRGRAEYWFEEFGEEVYKKSIAGSIYPEARRIVNAHLDKGHTVAIISSATKYQILPAARDLGIEFLLCTELEVDDGIFTGNVISPTCFGEGKRMAAEDLAAEEGCKLSESFFYTDSDDDLPLVEAVGRPRILNPNKSLAKIAKERSWPVYKFTSRGRPGVGTMLRTGMAYSALPSALAVSSTMWAATGRKRDMLNMATSLWSDYATAVTGIELNVEGEEHLWSHRPAVFIFNHQSSVDTLIIPKLLRRDFTGIGKKEIGDFPVIGQLFKFADVILIDRSDAKKAIEAMKPVVETIQKDKLSVALSPEGTRSVSTRLGSFKKGAFHIAMQAGVPIVPIVIHNAVDALPRGQNFARAADIKVTVLEPIDTSDWEREYLDDYIEQIRDLFLEALGQLEEHQDDISLDHWDEPLAPHAEDTIVADAEEPDAPELDLEPEPAPKAAPAPKKTRKRTATKKTAAKKTTRKKATAKSTAKSRSKANGRATQ
ncbi:MAG: HAD-IB family hydrolase [Aquisalinus sp.]|nr:HAD-IB family hydrolase [Aquisalinus sp.]